MRLTDSTGPGAAGRTHRRVLDAEDGLARARERRERCTLVIANALLVDHEIEGRFERRDLGVAVAQCGGQTVAVRERGERAIRRVARAAPMAPDDSSAQVATRPLARCYGERINEGGAMALERDLADARRACAAYHLERAVR